MISAHLICFFTTLSMCDCFMSESRGGARRGDGEERGGGVLVITMGDIPISRGK